MREETTILNNWAEVTTVTTTLTTTTITTTVCNKGKDKQLLRVNDEDSWKLPSHSHLTCNTVYCMYILQKDKVLKLIYILHT